MCLRHLIRQDKPKKLVYQINEVKDFVLICLNRCSFCLFFLSDQTRSSKAKRGNGASRRSDSETTRSCKYGSSLLTWLHNCLNQNALCCLKKTEKFLLAKKQAREKWSAENWGQVRRRPAQSFFLASFRPGL